MTLVAVLAGARPVAAAPAAEPRARVALELSLGAPVPGSEGLGYFLPEIARAITDGMERGGVTVARGASTGPTPLALTITVEERSSDRVVLVAKARGQRLEADGPVESMDLVVDELIARLLPLCIEGVVVPRLSARLPRGKEPSPAPATDRERAPVANPAAQATSPTPTTSSPASSSAPPTATPGPPPTPAPTPAPATTAPAPVATPAPPTPTPEPAPEPKPQIKPGAIADPYGPDARVLDPNPTPLAGGPGFVRGRVVVHTIVDPPGADPGTGSIATQALYATLQRRLRLSVVPLGTGVTALQVAADEGQRAQSRAVVMARLDGYALYAGAYPDSGPTARMRMELSVVREGRLAMRRLLLAETPVGAIAAAMAEGRRGRQLDPTYLAIQHALETMLADLTLALQPGP